MVASSHTCVVYALVLAPGVSSVGLARTYKPFRSQSIAELFKKAEQRAPSGAPEGGKLALASLQIFPSCFLGTLLPEISEVASALSDRVHVALLDAGSVPNPPASVVAALGHFHRQPAKSYFVLEAGWTPHQAKNNFPGAIWLYSDAELETSLVLVVTTRLLSPTHKLVLEELARAR